MLSVSLPLDADLAIAALVRARAEGMEFEAFILSTLRDALHERSTSPERLVRAPEHWLDEAVQRAKCVEAPAEFKLQDLFTRDEWRGIPSPTVFGKAFRKISEQQGFACHVGKTPANQAIYKRI